jgi:molybdate-binding protein
VIAAPPLFVGAVKVTVALASPAAAATLVGALGTVEGVTGLEAVEADEVPMLFVADTLNVYAAPLVRPDTVQGLAVAVHVPPETGLELLSKAWTV